jgi:uncharacterized membrane protein YcaP (DUF421 family)
MIIDYAEELLGLNAVELQPHQMCVRAVVIFFISLFIIRISAIRVFGKFSAFDNITMLMLGAIMGRAVVTTQSLTGSILALLVIMLLHRFVAWLSFRSRKAGALLKGKQLILMKDGKKYQKNLNRTHITEADILEALRRDLHVTTLDKVKEVYLERSGDISIISDEIKRLV